MSDVNDLDYQLLESLVNGPYLTWDANVGYEFNTHRTLRWPCRRIPTGSCDRRVMTVHSCLVQCRLSVQNLRLDVGFLPYQQPHHPPIAAPPLPGYAPTSVLRNTCDFAKLLDIALRSAIVDKELSE
jgi:hypothetical protein